MLAIIFCLIASFSSLKYKTGDVYTYKYQSNVKTSADQGQNDDQTQINDLSCTASFTVLLETSAGYFIQMNIKDVAATVGMDQDLENHPANPDTDEFCSYPVHFTQAPNGVIKDVVMNEEEDKDIANMKLSIIYSLASTISDTPSPDFKTVQMIDQIGSHYDHIQTIQEGSKVVVNSHYSQSDILHLLDGSATPQDLDLVVSSVHTIESDHITSVTGSMSVILNKGPVTQTNDDEEPAISFTSHGTHQLTAFKQSNAVIDFPYESVEDFLNDNKQLKRVPHTRPDFYKKRRPVPPPKPEEESYVPNGCDPALTACYSFDKTWNVGNSNVGLTFKVSFVAGITKGCSTASRSYMIGAYATLNVIVIKHTFSIVDAYAEYGQLNGSPTRNAIELKILGQSIYKKSFPWFECYEKSFTLINWSVGPKFEYSILVYIIKLSLYIQLSVTFTASLNFELCVQQLTAKVSLVPKLSVSLSGGVSASIWLAQAGIEIGGKVSDYLDPTPYIDGNLCRIGFSVYNNLDPIEVFLNGWYQVKGFHGWKFTWGDKHTITFWRHSWAGRRDKIYDGYWGAK